MVILLLSLSCLLFSRLLLLFSPLLFPRPLWPPPLLPSDGNVWQSWARHFSKSQVTDAVGLGYLSPTEDDPQHDDPNQSRELGASWLKMPTGNGGRGRNPIARPQPARDVSSPWSLLERRIREPPPSKTFINNQRSSSITESVERFGYQTDDQR